MLAPRRIARRLAATAALVLAPLALAPGSAGAEVYRWVDEQGVVHLTDAPTDHRFTKFRPSQGGSGKGIDLIARRASIRGLGIARPEFRHAAYTPGAELDADAADAYDALIERMARRFDVPAALVKAVVRAESNFQRLAVSRKGAQGLMQLMPATAAELGVEDPFDPEENVWGGTRYLRALKDRFGSWQHALAAYNAGPTAVEQYGGVPPYQETQAYVERVLHYYRRYDGDPAR